MFPGTPLIAYSNSSRWRDTPSSPVGAATAAAAARPPFEREGSVCSAPSAVNDGSSPVRAVKLQGLDEATPKRRSTTAAAVAAPSLGKSGNIAAVLPCVRERVDTIFDLPPALITCLVRHTDGQHQPLATPAQVEWCLRDLQRQLMPWVPVEQLFGSTKQPAMSVGASPHHNLKDERVKPPFTTSTIGSSSATPHTGSYLEGTHVHLQLAKTTDIASITSRTSVLHLLLYAVNEPASKPAVLVHIAQEWRAALAQKGEGGEYLVLLVHSDLLIAEESPPPLEEATESCGGVTNISPSVRQNRTKASDAAGPSAANASPSSSSVAPPQKKGPSLTLGQARADAAMVLVRKYYRELRDAKFTPQQMTVYTPNETSARILECLRPAFVEHGARLQQAFEAYLAQKRLHPQDPKTKPLGALRSVTSGTTVPAPSSTLVANTADAALPSAVSSTEDDARVRRCTSPPASPQKSQLSPLPSLYRQQQQPPQVPALTPTRRYWSVQELWRCGYDLAVHYLQCGFVFDARAVLERLFLEYYNNSDDYVFLSSCDQTLQRLGRVPNLFDSHGHAGWALGKTGYPKGLDAGAELMEGLLLVASAEISCSLLLGDAAAAMARHRTFVQVTREKFEESSSVVDGAVGAEPTAKISLMTHQDFFLLQCYLSGLRVWWSASGLCRPLRTMGTGPLVHERSHAEAPLSSISRIDVEPHRTHEMDSETTKEDSVNRRGNGSTEASDGYAGEPFVQGCTDAGIRYSLTNPSFAEKPDGAGSVARMGGTEKSGVPPAAVKENRKECATEKLAKEAPSVSFSAKFGGTTADEKAEEEERPYLLLFGSEDTAQASVTYLVALASTIGLLPPNMEPEEVFNPPKPPLDADETAARLYRRACNLQQRQLRRRCIEAAGLLEQARDALAAVAHDLGYLPFSDLPLSHRTTTPTGHDAFANIQELSTPEQALELWRTLTIMAVLALRLAEQRRRECHLCTRLAMTYLQDHPRTTARIAAARLLPYVKQQGWQYVELFVRRLYVEAQERLMEQVGVSMQAGTPKGDVGGRLPGLSPWRHVFCTQDEYVLYRDCVLVLLSQSGGGLDKEREPGDGGVRGAKAEGLGGGGVAIDDVIGWLDHRLFTLRSRMEWWKELLRVDTQVMHTVFSGEPAEYPLEHFTSPLSVRVIVNETSPTASRPDEVNSRGSVPVTAAAACIPKALPATVVASVDDVVVLTFTALCTINPLERLVFPEGRSTEEEEEDAPLPRVRFQLTLESRKDWSDPEETAHEVHLWDGDSAIFDTQTHQLTVSFAFLVCHAGLYRVSRLRLCNGSTWLAHYPARMDVAGGVGRCEEWAIPLEGTTSWRGSSTARRKSPTVERFEQLVSHAAVLRVPEPRSKVHLRLTLPLEAHCFADSVDYATLEIELEDPLPLVALNEYPGQCTDLLSAGSAKVEAQRRGTGCDASSCDKDFAVATRCACNFGTGPVDLMLPHHAKREGEGPPQGNYRQLRRCGPGAIEDGDSEFHTKCFSTSTTAMRGLLADMKDGEAAPHAVHQTTPFVATVTLGTPSTHRPKSRTAAARGHLGMSFTSFQAAPCGTSASRVLGCSIRGGSGTGSGKRVLNDSLVARPSPPTDAAPLSRRVTAPTPQGSTTSEGRGGLGGKGSVGSLPFSEVHRHARGDANDRQRRYKAVFQSLRIGGSGGTGGEKGGAASSPSATAATTMASLQDDKKWNVGAHTSGVATPRTAVGDLALAPNPQASRPTGLLANTAPALSDSGALEHIPSVGGEERASRSAAAAPSPDAGVAIHGGVATKVAWTPLREVSGNAFELVLVHTDTETREGRDSTSTSTSSFHSLVAATAGTSEGGKLSGAALQATVARTVIPLHLDVFLQNLPSPEVCTTTTATAACGVEAGAALLKAERLVTADAGRETVIRLLPAAPHPAASSSTTMMESTDTPTGMTILRMRLRLPLLPLLLTPVAARAVRLQSTPTTVTTGKDSVVDGAVTPAELTANQARISFTCLRGREPCITTLSTVLPFQPAIDFQYAFKHFQGRVYCLVRLRNVLRFTSLWIRGAVLRVLDAEPSYEIVRVSEVYDTLLTTEWKPQEVLCILYELDLIASFHPTDAECTHRVQMEVLYSDWHKTYVTTPEEDRTVLCTMAPPSTVATAESVEVVHSDAASDAFPVAGEGGNEDDEDESGGDGGGRGWSQAPKSPLSVRDGVDAPSVLANAPIVVGEFNSGALNSAKEWSAPSGTHQSSESTLPSDAESDVTSSSAVHFNLAVLRYLEETCNTMWGPVASFRSKHLCLFNIIMYADSPWTMRFGAATNYPVPPASVPLTARTAASGADDESRQRRAPSRQHTPTPLAALSRSGSRNPGLSHHRSNGRASPHGDAFFGNAMVDQPADVVFVAGEPVRFCVRLQPQAHNWPEDAGVEQVFFIRLKYNPAEWMVIGKQRERRSLSLMEEVTVYFNAVPLLPPALDGAGKRRESMKGRPPPQDDENSSEDDGEESPLRRLAGSAVKDEGILQTPTVEMFWEREKATVEDAHSLAEFPVLATTAESASATAGCPPAHVDAVLGEAVLVDVVQFRTWVRVRKRGH